MQPELIRVDICIIGAGAAGLSVAAVAAQLDRKVALIEEHKMGGDCLNYGCVPSKALLAAAHKVSEIEEAREMGIKAENVKVDFKKVQTHVQNVIKAIEPHDSVERFEGLGVKVLTGRGEFISRHQVKCGNKVVQAKYFIIATGSKAFIPPIEGLDKVPFLTNETIFDLKTCPKHLVVIGGGPIGLEMAEAHCKLGAKVTVLEAFHILPKDDPEFVKILKKKLMTGGVDIKEGVKIQKISRKKGNIEIHCDNRKIIKASHLLIATGRRANLKGLNLEAAKIKTDEGLIVLDNRLRSSNKKIFVLGDAAGGAQFTHFAGYHAGIAIKNILFKIPAKAKDYVLPWVTYTKPELAHTGLTLVDARKKHDDIDIVTWPYLENDRALANRQTEGFVKIIARKNGLVLGVSIIGEQAGELINFWSFVIKEKNEAFKSDRYDRCISDLI
jgi:pyruvate/2-oxoglutarate dehydrogenase complex dihydrolipoamide dehydrogenase (E3) component